MKSACGNGNEGPLRLRAFFRPFAPDTAGTDRDFRLQHLVSRPFGVIIRVNKTSKPCLLIRFQHFSAVPGPHHQNQPGRDQDRCLFEIDPAQEQSGNQNRRVSQRRTHVRLCQHQQHGNPTSANALKISFHVRFLPPRFAKYRATTRIRISFTHSDG